MSIALLTNDNKLRNNSQANCMSAYPHIVAVPTFVSAPFDSLPSRLLPPRGVQVVTAMSHLIKRNAFTSTLLCVCPSPVFLSACPDLTTLRCDMVRPVLIISSSCCLTAGGRMQVSNTNYTHRQVHPI